MNAQLESGGDGTWRVTGVLDFASVPALYARTRDLLAAGPLELDLSGIESANSAGVALLLEWRRQAYRRGVDLRLSGLPESVRRVARLSEVEALLSGDPASTRDSVNGSTGDPAASL